MQKLVTRRVTTVSPIRLTSTMKKSSASICGAILDASGGNSAKFVIHLTRNSQSTGLMWLMPLSVHLWICSGFSISICSCAWPVVLPRVPAEHDQHESTQREDRDQPAQLHHPRNDQRMLVGGGIVVVAVSENVVHRRADAVGRGLHQAQPQI